MCFLSSAVRCQPLSRALCAFENFKETEVSDQSTKAEVIAKSVEKISDSRGLEAIGNGLGLGIMALAFFMFMPMLMLASKWDGKLHEQKQCFEIKELEGVAYKLNTCTGEIEKIDSSKP